MIREETIAAPHATGAASDAAEDDRAPSQSGIAHSDAGRLSGSRTCGGHIGDIASQTRTHYAWQVGVMNGTIPPKMTN